MYTVYMRATPSGKRYVGITCQKPTQRWRNGKGYSHNSYFKNAINKYGWGNIEHEIMFECVSKEEACDIERLLIGILRTTKREHGFNITDGGDVGFIMNDECRARLCEIRKGQNIGHIVTAETRQKISKANKGAIFTKEHREKLSKVKRKPCRCIETGAVYESTLDVEEQLGIRHNNISGVCNHRPHHNTAGGYHWEWVNQ